MLTNDQGHQLGYFSKAKTKNNPLSEEFLGGGEPSREVLLLQGGVPSYGTEELRVLASHALYLQFRNLLSVGRLIKLVSTWVS